jgi:hypothetical protein
MNRAKLVFLRSLKAETAVWQSVEKLGDALNALDIELSAD